MVSNISFDRQKPMQSTKSVSPVNSAESSESRKAIESRVCPGIAIASIQPPPNGRRMPSCSLIRPESG